MARRALTVVILLVAQSSEAQSAPRKMTVAGDSLSQAALADGTYPGDQPWNSWAYGTTQVVTSLLMRYRATLNHNMTAQPVAKDGANHADRVGSVPTGAGDAAAVQAGS